MPVQVLWLFYLSSMYGTTICIIFALNCDTYNVEKKCLKIFHLQTFLHQSYNSKCSVSKKAVCEDVFCRYSRSSACSEVGSDLVFLLHLAVSKL